MQQYLNILKHFTQHLIALNKNKRVTLSMDSKFAVNSLSDCCLMSNERYIGTHYPVSEPTGLCSYSLKLHA